MESFFRPPAAKLKRQVPCSYRFAVINDNLENSVHASLYYRGHPDAGGKCAERMVPDVSTIAHGRSGFSDNLCESLASA